MSPRPRRKGGVSRRPARQAASRPASRKRRKPSAAELERSLRRVRAEHKAIEAALRESQRKYQALIETTSDFTWEMDAQGRYTYCSPQMKALWGIEPELMIGKTPFDLMPEEHREHAARLFQDLAAHPGPFRGMELTAYVPDGRLIRIEVSGVPFFDEGGRLLGFRGVSRDITERVRSEEALRESEGRFRLALRNSRVSVAVQDLDLRYVWAYDPRAPRPDEAVGKRDADLLPRAEAEHLEAVKRRVLRENVEHREHLWLERQDGRGYFDLHLEPIRDEAGLPVALGTAAIDLTPMKLAEEAFERSEQQFRALVENVNAGVALIDESGQFSLYNRRFLEMFGLPADTGISNVNAQDWSAWQVLDENGRLLHVDEHPVRKAARTGRAVRDVLVEVRLPGGGGAAWMLITAEPLLGERGRPERVICTYHDMTERRLVELALRQANQRLQEEDRRKNEFLALLSHELRNPLAPISNGLSVLERLPPGSAAAATAFEVIRRQTGQLARLVDDLLDVTRIARNKIELQRSRVDLNGLVRRTLDDHRSLFEERGVGIESRLTAGQLPVNGDEARLAQTVGNLLQNAAKFTPAGGTVTVRTETTPGGSARVSVSDSGVGIAPEVLPRLFQPFMQADTTLERGRGGLGLGLALVKSLVEMHGGRVQAHSEGTGKGTTFTIEIPLDPSASPRVEPAPLAGATTKARVLVIEDNTDAAQCLGVMLELGHHAVRLAANGTQGLAAAREFEPQVVLCDIGLPGMDGFEVARAFKADESLSGIPLVALSGYAREEDVQRAADAGFVRHLAKPASPETLEALLAELTRSPVR